MQEEKRARILRELPETLTGERVIVRPLRPGDGAKTFAAVNAARERLGQWLPWVEGCRTEEDSEAHARLSAANWLLREEFGLLIESRENGALLGAVGLHPRDWSVPSFEIGYWLADGAEGKGYMTEAVRLVCRLAFDSFGANRVFIQCDAKNDRSAGVARRLGFVHEATLRNSGRAPNGALRDTLVFGMTPDEYRSGSREQGSGSVR